MTMTNGNGNGNGNGGANGRGDYSPHRNPQARPGSVEEYDWPKEAKDRPWVYVTAPRSFEGRERARAARAALREARILVRASWMDRTGEEDPREAHQRHRAELQFATVLVVLAGDAEGESTCEQWIELGEFYAQKRPVIVSSTSSAFQTSLYGARAQFLCIGADSMIPLQVQGAFKLAEMMREAATDALRRAGAFDRKNNNGGGPPSGRDEIPF